jgi:hypothetical protein
MVPVTLLVPATVVTVMFFAAAKLIHVALVRVPVCVVEPPVCVTRTQYVDPMLAVVWLYQFVGDLLPLPLTPVPETDKVPSALKARVQVYVPTSVPAQEAL